MEPTTELAVRIACYAAVFAAMAAWEVFSPRRQMMVGRWPRWPSNLGILVLDAALIRVLIPTAAVGVAVIAAERGWGLLNVIALPGWLQGCSAS